MGNEVGGDQRLTKQIKIPTGNGQAIFMKPAKGGCCVVHDWPTEGMGRLLVQAMKASYPVGIDVCVECIKRAKYSFKLKVE